MSEARKISILREKANPGPNSKGGWWGVHYDSHGIQRERRTFASRDKARAWVKQQKEGDLRQRTA